MLHGQFKWWKVEKVIIRLTIVSVHKYLLYALLWWHSARNTIHRSCACNIVLLKIEFIISENIICDNVFLSIVEDLLENKDVFSVKSVLWYEKSHFYDIRKKGNFSGRNPILLYHNSYDIFIMCIMGRCMTNFQPATTLISLGGFSLWK